MWHADNEKWKMTNDGGNWTRFSSSISYNGMYPLHYDHIYLGGARGVMVIVIGWVQILDETDCISHNTNTLGKGMNPIILPLVGQTRFFSLGEATSLGEGKLWIQTC